jgi:hypothetical protein
LYCIVTVPRPQPCRRYLGESRWDAEPKKKLLERDKEDKITDNRLF